VGLETAIIHRYLILSDVRGAAGNGRNPCCI